MRAGQAFCIFLAGGVLLGVSAPPTAAERAAFQTSVQPFLKKTCLGCHNAKLPSGQVNMAPFQSVESVIASRGVWERMVEKMRTGEMPPKGLPRPKAEELQAVTQWVEALFDRVDAQTPPDPGRVTARRLNRYEYNNTVRDLIGVDFNPAADFPADDSGYGFDSIGDVLTLSPVLMEKYLAAAEQITRRAIFTEPPPKPTRERIQPAKGVVKRSFPVEADYEIRVGIPGRSTGPTLAVRIDGVQAGEFAVEQGEGKRRNWDFKTRLKSGTHAISASLAMDYVEIRGPFNPAAPEKPAGYSRIFICQPENDADCARKILAEFTRKAWRRPVTAVEIDSLLRFVDMARQDGEPFERSIQLALQAALVSPHFLFRIERTPHPVTPGPAHHISEHELASRLSYFLWSSMPDDALLALAEKSQLRKPGVLDAQIERMLADLKSWALVENFAGQWLQLRNLESVKPDPDRFPSFNEELRAAMLAETQMFFQSMMREDRSVLDFLDADYTYLNEPLAKHYGMEGVVGAEMRRVPLAAGQRAGVLTHASVLTVSSYPTRTSPVIRGKWLLENILNSPPPPPPPNVPSLDEQQVGITGTLRQQMEKHRSNPVCSSCHSRMDALGFGLENFDAIGRWRTMDGNFPVDSAGTLPNGKSFQTPAELIRLLRSYEKDAFANGLTEKLLTYALGRGLENYDRPAVRLISRRLAAGDYRFHTLVREIAHSAPFQMRRGDAK